jgi:oxygen-independent coproporphyrinogen-3 oxidase
MNHQSQRGIPQALVSHYDHLGTLTDDDLFSVDQGIDSLAFADELQRQAPLTNTPVSLYVHVPFCAVRCLNCDRNTTVTHDPQQIDAYIDTLDEEMGLVASRLGRQRPVDRLRLGGGTPNYLTDSQLVRLVEIVDRHFGLSSDTRASLEANPCRASASQLALLVGLGFRRIDFSIGDLDPQVQLAIGRVQSSAMIEDAFATAREVGFESVNLGLRYGLPHQTETTMGRTIQRLLALAPDRISYEAYNQHTGGLGHQCAIDSLQTHTSLADRLALFHGIVEGLTADGYQWIGLDCFARDTDALSIAQSEHRLTRDWLGYSDRAKSDGFLGFGTNAISELGDLCVQNYLDIAHWRGAINQQRCPVRGGLRLSPRQMRRRDAICHLMCNLELLDREVLHGLADGSADEGLWADFVTRGLVDVLPDRLRLTDEGRHMLHHAWSGSWQGTGGLSWQTGQNL